MSITRSAINSRWMWTTFLAPCPGRFASLWVAGGGYYICTQGTNTWQKNADPIVCWRQFLVITRSGLLRFKSAYDCSAKVAYLGLPTDDNNWLWLFKLWMSESWQHIEGFIMESWASGGFVPPAGVMRRMFTTLNDRLWWVNVAVRYVLMNRVTKNYAIVVNYEFVGDLETIEKPRLLSEFVVSSLRVII